MNVIIDVIKIADNALQGREGFKDFIEGLKPLINTTITQYTITQRDCCWYYDVDIFKLDYCEEHIMTVIFVNNKVYAFKNLTKEELEERLSHVRI